MTDKPFKELCSLIDQFWQTRPPVVKCGSKPDYEDDLYLKLYWYGLLSQCPTRDRLLRRAWKHARWLFKKNGLQHLFTTTVTA
jgi:hypothetical protein